MIRFTTKLTAVAIVAALALMFPATSRAQDDGSGAGPDQTIQIRGRVSAFDGAYSLVVRDEQGYLDNISLHPGTIVNPTGLTLAPGMVVSVIGFNDGPSIGANEVDTPYTVYGGTPFYDGHPWTYFGAGVALGVFFASPVWWHGDSFGGGYRFVDGHRYWAHVDRARLYRGGYFRGNEFVARRGGWDGHGDPRVVSHDMHRGPDAHDYASRSVADHRAVDVHGRPIDDGRGSEGSAHGYASAHGYGAARGGGYGGASRTAISGGQHPATAARAKPAPAAAPAAKKK
jgi:hypothetical protein